jgi:hypothetical protein
MKYQYKLVKENEGEEEVSGLKGLQTQNELVLSALEGRTAKELLDIINDPTNLDKVFTKEASGLKDLKIKVFGDRPNLRATLKPNIDIYKENGTSFYSKIENVVGEKFDRKGAEINKDKAGNVRFIFPKNTKYNIDIVEKYFDTMDSGGKAKKADLRPKEVDEFTLKFPLSDGPTLKKILDNANLESGKDYKLNKQEVIQENLRILVKKEIKNLFENSNLSTMERLILQAEKDGHISRGGYSEMVLDTAKKIAKKWDELSSEEQKVMRDTYYQAFLKKIKR